MEGEPMEPGIECWQAVRNHWRRDHAGRKVTDDRQASQKVQTTVLAAPFPKFSSPAPLKYVVEVLDLMWEFGYDGHNLEEVAQDIVDEQALGGFGMDNGADSSSSSWGEGGEGKVI
eukprot:TRINITY_DN9943_c0_g1_i2.p2 TRINITY_DN9943_c0_g1~~TRINITY_DN9943_c0_g1_i2.p2  ORF type:complete len:116 (+),score=28.12 TRINITY_DN9943_c0_g1_i2:197-544(+)